mmetsp:Transcript_11562/g.35175  ORF Transcript_11562/g.35175 Transcript_11562/m.35175 type:complete len:211 (+) Transcript_11562:1354-1986(+)
MPHVLHSPSDGGHHIRQPSHLGDGSHLHGDVKDVLGRLRGHGAGDREVVAKAVVVVRRAVLSDELGIDGPRVARDENRHLKLPFFRGHLCRRQVKRVGVPVEAELGLHADALTDSGHRGVQAERDHLTRSRCPWLRRQHRLDLRPGLFQGLPPAGGDPLALCLLLAPPPLLRLFGPSRPERLEALPPLDLHVKVQTAVVVVLAAPLHDEV